VKPLRSVSTDQALNGACSNARYQCVIDPCLDVPPTLDECASYTSADAIDSCVKVIADDEYYQATYC
jgi:hypothetical protein